jgi:SagB-type dehydrogenase family enzyme
MSDSQLPTALAVVQDYHRRTAHRFEAYARGPEALDWDAQPAPFRHFAGAPAVRLPRLGEEAPDSALALALARPFGSLGETPPVPVAGDLPGLAALLQLALGITAWKSLGPDRWAVRSNPSSGNLHPLEAYLVLRGWPGLTDGVHHYRPEDHALELRARFAPGYRGQRRALVGLSSVMWREAWKYGERAFRYCQLDAGHGVAALAYAAGLVGWGLREEAQVGHATLARVLGLDRGADFPYRRKAFTEREEPELLLALELPGEDAEPVEPEDLLAWAATAEWSGPASPIDPFPLYDWGVVGEVAAATRRADGGAGKAQAALPGSPPGADGPPAREVILQRRSAQRFDPGHVLPRQDFEAILAATLPHGGPPWRGLARTDRLDLLLYVHRVEGLAASIYFLARGGAGADGLPALCAGREAVVEVTGEVTDLRLWRLLEAEPAQLRRVARSLHCHQDIAATACFALGMVTDVDAALAADPAAYRDLHREAGLIGQALYLEAQARGLQGTGIGCFFDEPVREVVGLENSGLRTLYHFTVGLGVADPRIETGAAYA